MTEHSFTGAALLTPVLLLVFSWLLLRMVATPDLGRRLRVLFRSGTLRLRAPVVSIFERPSTRKRTLLLAAAFVAGALATVGWTYLGPVLPLLLLATVLGLFAESGDSSRQRYLVEVLGLLALLRDRVREGHSVIDALLEAARALPESPVQARVEQVRRQHEARVAPPESLNPLKGLSPFLDQLVSDVCRSGWESSPTLLVTLDRVASRAGRVWDQAAAGRSRRDQTGAFIPPLRMFVWGAVLAGIVQLVSLGVLPIEAFTVALGGAGLLVWVLKSLVARRIVLVSTLAVGILSPALVGVSAEGRAQWIPIEPGRQAPTVRVEPRIAAAVERPAEIVPVARCVVSTGVDPGYAHLRLGPGMAYPVLVILDEGDVLEYVGEIGSFEAGYWREVSAGGLDGWIFASLCLTDTEQAAVPVTDESAHAEPLPVLTEPAADTPETASLSDPAAVAEAQPICTVSTGFSLGAAHLRSGPGMDYEVVGYVHESQRLKYWGEDGDYYQSGIWFRVEGEEKGWLYGGLCEVEGHEAG